MRPRPRMDDLEWMRESGRKCASGILPSCRPTTLKNQRKACNHLKSQCYATQRSLWHTVTGLNANCTRTWLQSNYRLYTEDTQIDLAMVECMAIVPCARVPGHAIVVVAIVVERARIRVHARATEILDPSLVRNLDGLVAMWAHSPRIIWTVGITTVHELLRHLLRPATVEETRAIVGTDGPTMHRVAGRAKAIGSEGPARRLILKSHPMVSEAAPERHVLGRISVKHFSIAFT